MDRRQKGAWGLDYVIKTMEMLQMEKLHRKLTQEHMGENEEDELVGSRRLMLQIDIHLGTKSILLLVHRIPWIVAHFVTQHFKNLGMILQMGSILMVMRISIALKMISYLKTDPLVHP